MKKQIIFLLTIIVLLLTPTVSVNAATTKVAKPTYTVTVSDTGKVEVIVRCSTAGAKIYYTTNHKTPTTRNKYVKSGATLTYSYGSAPYLTFRTYGKKTYSKTVSVNTANYVFEKYQEMIKNIVDTQTAGLTTDEEKVKALWDWVMMNTEYAFDADHRPNTVYASNRSLIFKGKSVCEGFSSLWIDLTALIGIKSEYVSGGRHVWNVTEIRGKWFVVDTTHSSKVNTTDDVDYDNLLNNAKAKYSDNYHGYNCSSRRYAITDSCSYFDYLQDVTSGIAYFNYNSQTDRYTITYYEEDEF